MAARAPTFGHYHPRLIEAAVALNENRLEIAERILKPHLKKDPFDAAAVRMLAELAARIGRTRDAENLLRPVRPSSIARFALGATQPGARRKPWTCSTTCSPKSLRTSAIGI